MEMSEQFSLTRLFFSLDCLFLVVHPSPRQQLLSTKFVHVKESEEELFIFLTQRSASLWCIYGQEVVKDKNSRPCMKIDRKGYLWSSVGAHSRTLCLVLANQKRLKGGTSSYVTWWTSCDWSSKEQPLAYSKVMCKKMLYFHKRTHS